MKVVSVKVKNHKESERQPCGGQTIGKERKTTAVSRCTVCLMNQRLLILSGGDVQPLIYAMISVGIKFWAGKGGGDPSACMWSPDQIMGMSTVKAS